MTAKACVDRVDDLQLSERNGVVEKLTRKIRVINLGGTTFGILDEALNVSGVPVPGTILTGTRYANLILVGREPRAFDESTVDINLLYEHVLGAGNQDLTNIAQARGIIRGKARCSVVQKDTNFYKENGTGVQTQITVQHTFPADDADIPNQTVTQGGKISVHIPQKNFQFDGFFDTDQPWVLESRMVGAINSAPWRGRGTWEWMCIEVTWEWWGVVAKDGGGTINRYKFHFEFQHDPDTWNPYAVFEDERTNRPPPNLVPNVGYKQIPYHTQTNYNQVFNAYFEGWQQAFVLFVSVLGSLAANLLSL